MRIFLYVLCKPNDRLHARRLFAVAVQAVVKAFFL